MSDKTEQSDAPTEVSEEDLDKVEGGALRASATPTKVQKVVSADEKTVAETRVRSNLAIP